MENFAELTSLYFILTRVTSTGFPQDMRHKQLVDNVCSAIDLLYEQGYKTKEDCRACFKGACHFTDHPFTKSDTLESEIPVGKRKNFSLTRKLRSDVIVD